MTSTSDLVSRAEALGSAVNGAPEHLPEVLPELFGMLDRSQTDDVLVAVIEALGLAWTESACLAVVPYANHPDRAVRLAAVQTMPGGIESDTGSITVASALIDRFDDSDSGIRDWATFGVGSILDVDSDEIRSALRSNLEDPDLDVQCEALVGLARRGDPSAVEATLRLLSAESVGRLVVEATGLIGDPTLFPALERLATWWDVDQDLLDNALRECGESSKIRGVRRLSSGPRRCEASRRAGPRGGTPGKPVCGWYWPVEWPLPKAPVNVYHHYCQLAPGHDGDHTCKDGAVHAPEARVRPSRQGVDTSPRETAPDRRLDGRLAAATTGLDTLGPLCHVVALFLLPLLPSLLLSRHRTIVPSPLPPNAGSVRHS